MAPLEEFAKEYLNRNPKMTALEIFAKEMIHLGFPIPQGRYEKCMEMEKQQHGNTWDAAIKAHDDRGHVHARSLVDFDEYYEEQFKK